jgi:hypothetical protein
MKKRVYGRRNPSQTINNFYTLITIVMMTVVITIYTKYIRSTPHEVVQQETFKPTILPCQTEFNIEQKITQPNLLKEAFILFEQGNYALNGGLLLLDNSVLKDKVSLKTIETFFDNTIDVVSILNAQQFLNIKYEIIEKKTNNLRLLVSFRISSNEVLRMYTNLNHTKENEISQKVECIMNSFKHNAKQ